MKLFFLTVIISLLLASCGRSALDRALRLAGDNRAELEKVLAHYAASGDGLELRAAGFLIANMPGHRSLIPDSIADFRQKYEAVYLDEELTTEQKKEQLSALSENYDLSNCVTEDVGIISAEYLIDNIDRSFDIWRSSPYSRHLTFDEFCELILPYKCAELQELDNWKEVCVEKFGDVFDMVPVDDDQYPNTRYAAMILSKKLMADFGINYVLDYGGRVLHNARTMSELQFGQCKDHSLSTVAVMRSLGIPSCMESIPQWGHKTIGHAWHTILNDNGSYMPAPWNLESVPGDAFFPNDKLPKIYRTTFAPNRRFEEYFRKSRVKLPTFNIFMKDVTDLYLRTTDIAIPVKTRGLKDRYVYLAVFKDRSSWGVVDLSELRGRKARFKGVGNGIAYIVLGCDGRRLVPISDPFILDVSGEVRRLEPDTGTPRSVELTRKFPKSSNTSMKEYLVIGGQIQAANTPDFSDADTIHVFDDPDYPDLIPTDTTKRYRYWRFCQNSRGKCCSLAELQLFRAGSTDEPATGALIAPPSEMERMSQLKNMADGDWLTSYTSAVWTESWAGFDFGEPVAVGNVRVVPRSDDNAVRSGDEYELKYWSDGRWVSLGRQVAGDRFLIYDNVPENALLLLSNNTRGVEERPFTCENDSVVWW